LNFAASVPVIAGFRYCRQVFRKNHISTPRRWRKITPCPAGKRKQIFALRVFREKISFLPPSVAGVRSIDSKALVAN